MCPVMCVNSALDMALKHVIGQMPKGGVLVFDQLGDAKWPGEALAVQDVLGFRNCAFKRLSGCPDSVYMVLQ